METDIIKCVVNYQVNYTKYYNIIINNKLLIIIMNHQLLISQLKSKLFKLQRNPIIRIIINNNIMFILYNMINNAKKIKK